MRNDGRWTDDATLSHHVSAQTVDAVVDVVVRVADEELLDLLQRFVLRLGHARVQVERADQRGRPVDDEQAGQREPRLHGQKRLGEHERHEERQRGRQPAGDAATPRKRDRGCVLHPASATLTLKYSAISIELRGLLHVSRVVPRSTRRHARDHFFSGGKILVQNVSHVGTLFRSEISREVVFQNDYQYFFRKLGNAIKNRAKTLKIYAVTRNRF